MGRKHNKPNLRRPRDSEARDKSAAAEGVSLRQCVDPARWWNSRWAALLAAILIALATAAAYANSFGGAFVLDDELAITKNATIRRLWPIWPTLCPPNSGETVSGRPLLNLSLAVNYAIGQCRVWSYHAVNLAIHILAALVLFGILRRTFLLPALSERCKAAAVPLALVIALLWAVHPLQTESVTYVVQRAESLVGLLYLLTLYCVLRGAGSTRARWWYAGATLACLLGMASKEVMVSAPLIVLLYDRTFLAGSFREAWRRRRGVYVAIAGTWLLLAYLVVSTGSRGGTAGFGIGAGSWAYLCTQFGAIVNYLKLCVWPHPLVFYYGTDIAQAPHEIVPYAVMVVLLGLATVAALWRWPKIGFLGAWFFAILAPTSSVVPVATQTIAEHRMYLPLAAVMTGLAVGGFLAGRRLVGRGVVSATACLATGGLLAILAIVALSIVTFHRNKDYGSEISIWQDTIAKSPRNASCHYNLGLLMAELGRTDDAIACYEKALEIRPNFAEACNNLGTVLAGRGQIDTAAVLFQKAVRLKPQYVEARKNLERAQSLQKASIRAPVSVPAENTVRP